MSHKKYTKCIEEAKQALAKLQETDSRMYGDDSVFGSMIKRGDKKKPTAKKPCSKGKGKPEEKKPRPFMGYEQTDTDDEEAIIEGSYVHSKKELLQAIKDSKKEIERLKKEKQTATKNKDTKALQRIELEIDVMEDNILDAQDQLGK